MAVDAEQVPGTVGAGSVVDVYLGRPRGREASRRRPRARRWPRSRSWTPPLAETFGTSGKRQLVLAVEEPEVRRFFPLLGSLDGPVVTVVRRG